MKYSLLLLILVVTGCAVTELDRTPLENTYTYEIITDELQNPWGMSLFSDEELLITEKNTGLVHLNLVTQEITRISGIPEFISPGQGGMLDVAYHEGYIYLTYVAEHDGAHSTRIGRGMYHPEEQRITNFTVLHISEPAISGGAHFGSRILINGDYLYYTTGDRGRKNFGPEHVSQDTTNTLGAVIRLHLNGTIPQTNPHITHGTARDEIYTYGHRNPQGMTLHPRTGEIWISDHGENDGDEINILRAGANYGWPVTHTGCLYGTRRLFAENPFEREDIENPVFFWECGTGGFPPAGMTFYHGEKYPELYGALLIGNLAGRELGVFDVDGRTITQKEPVYTGQRVRDVMEHPDGQLYFITDNGALKTLQIMS